MSGTNVTGVTEEARGESYLPGRGKNASIGFSRSYSQLHKCHQSSVTFVILIPKLDQPVQFWLGLLLCQEKHINSSSHEYHSYR